MGGFGLSWLAGGRGSSVSCLQAWFCELVWETERERDSAWISGLVSIVSSPWLAFTCGITDCPGRAVWKRTGRCQRHVDKIRPSSILKAVLEVIHIFLGWCRRPREKPRSCWRPGIAVGSGPFPSAGYGPSLVVVGGRRPTNHRLFSNNLQH